MHIVHLTSAHPRSDTRVFHKQCKSIAARGHCVTLVVADGKGDDLIDGVAIRDVGGSSGRLGRMVSGAARVYREAKSISADVYHLHDPELIPWGLALRRLGASTVFDAHEDLPAQVLTKHYIPKFVRRTLAASLSLAEVHAFPRFDGLIGATPTIAGKLAKLNPHTKLVANYPLTEEFRRRKEYRPRHILFVGSMSRIRGIAHLAEAMSLARQDAVLHLVGPMADDGVAQDVEQSPGRSKMRVFGHLDRACVANQMEGASCGVVTFLAAPNHMEAQPNKLFEYMSAGIPVIASDFPLWRELVEGANCGYCVDPSSPAAIAAAIDRIIADPKEAEAMGQRGRLAIENGLNWETQADTLLQMYDELVTPK